MSYSVSIRFILGLFILAFALYAVFMLSNLFCRATLVTCVTNADCGAGAACIDFGSNEVRCAPLYCSQVHFSLNKFPTVVWMENEAGVIAHGTANIAHWMLNLLPPNNH